MTLSELFDRIGGLRAAVIGDHCLDVYWQADMRLSELSRETPHHPLPVVEERMSPGAAANQAACLAALRPRQVLALGTLGRDWRGQVLAHQLAGLGVDASGLAVRDELVTNAYIKPLRAGISDVVYEDPRIDFENRAPLSTEAEAALLAALEAAAPGLDLLLVCDQLAHGCITPAVRERINGLGQQGLTVVVDSRSRIDAFRHALLKPNEVEALRATGEEEAGPAARALARLSGRPALVTLGDRGCVVSDGEGEIAYAALPVPPPVDAVGAGDSFAAAFGLAYAAGAGMALAVRFASAAAAVTVKKIGCTGSASREEIASIW